MMPMTNELDFKKTNFSRNETDSPPSFFLYEKGNSLISVSKKQHNNGFINFIEGNTKESDINDFLLSFMSVKSYKNKDNNEKNFKFFIENVSYSNNGIFNYEKCLDKLSVNETLKADIIKEIKNHININEANFKKLYFSFINLASKIDSFDNINAKISVKIDIKTNLFSLDISRKSVFGFIANLNLQFCDNGNVNYFVMDNDDKDTSHIRGCVTNYKYYKRSFKFKSIVNFIFYGG